MSELCNITQPHYLRAMLQLLPRGYVWEWDENSAGRRVLAIIASELHRYHTLLCQLANYNIDRFIVGNQGWSAPDYERLLLAKFGIIATVTDGLTPFNCESSCEDPLLDERIVYVYVITVDDVNAVTPAIRDYLRQYQQSHTHYHIRDRQLTVTETQTILPVTVGSYELVTVLHEATEAEKTAAGEALNAETWTETYWDHVGGIHCESPIYTEDYHYVDVSADWTYPISEIPQMSGFAAIMQNLPPRTLLSFNR